MKRWQFSLRGLFVAMFVIAGLLAWLRYIHATPLQFMVVSVTSTVFLAAALLGPPRSIRAARTPYRVAYLVMQVCFFYTICSVACFASLSWQDRNVLTSQDLSLVPRGEFQDSYMAYRPSLSSPDVDEHEVEKRNERLRNRAKQAFQRRQSMSASLSISGAAFVLLCFLSNVVAAVGIARMRWYLLLTIPGAIAVVYMLSAEFLRHT